MRFADRFKFLMRITETCNKDLAAELSVDPSMISLMRTGRRKLPKNPAHIKKIALYFARHSTAEYQRRALSEMLGQASISPGMPAEVLADLLENWLLGEDDMLVNALDSIRPLPPKEPHEQPDTPEPMPKNQTMFFFGDEGRREVMRRVMAELRTIETPCTVLTAVDDNLEWLLSDYLLTKQLQGSMLEVIERGFSFCQIMPPLNFINRYAESLRFWLPLYATGRMEVYYYPRLRGNLYRHSIIIVPGRCVQFSVAISTGSANEITVFSTDLSLVNAFVRQYKEHLALCRQSLVAHRDPKDFLPCFADIFSRPGDIVQTVSPLSATSMPKELLEYYLRKTDDPAWKETLRKSLEIGQLLERQLEHHLLIDMSGLATAAQVRAGEVCVGVTSPTYPEHPRYTPQTYVLHLKNILRLMDRYKNYCFLPVPSKELPAYNLIANESGLALLIRTDTPPLMLEIRRPEMIVALREHLLRRADAVGYDGIHREKIRMEIRALIQELGG